MKNFETLIEAINHFKSVGYETDFNLAFDKLICSENLIRLHPEDFEILEAIRFDNNTDPGEESILYVVQEKDGNHKGTFVSAFGTYADDISKELLDKLSFHHS
jgi:hypothetical protein